MHQNSMINELGLFSFFLTVAMSGFLLTFLSLGFAGKSNIGKKLNIARSHYRGAIPLSGHPKFFLFLLILIPVELGVAMLGPMLLVQAILPSTWFGSALNPTNQLMWSGTGFMLSVFIAASAIRSL